MCCQCVANVMAGGVEKLLQACETHSSDSALQEVVCGALKNLTVLADNTQRFMALQGLRVILVAMRRHPDSQAFFLFFKACV
jgi:hypothetical protein